MEHLEGRQSVLAALEARQRRFELIMISYGAHEQKVQEVVDRAAELGVPVKMVDAQELNALAHGSSHGGVLALCSAKPRLSSRGLSDLFNLLTGPALFLLLEGVDDARNLGFTIRSAEALGAHAVLIKKHLWDFDSVEVARPSSGAYERMPLVQIEDVAPLQNLQKQGVQLVGCIAGARQSIYDIDMKQPTILAIGGEKRGLSGAVRNICDVFATIPTKEGASLSLSHAGGIVLAEAARQRRDDKVTR